ncbi:unnamed protein product [Pseudo-nitzschia multistriata]|uniref:Uncharacterized protein n=1 Tax=Pseudo-nitzschia multistriata TaxID=183589 RepID=A0A448ZLV9_9STRA|nr:unnamed protein product [Pseudo-nitzschia multistriata]
MCGMRRTRRTESHDQYLARSLNDGHPSGFRFLKFEEVAQCIPEVNDVNFCGIFTGIVYVYGKHQNEEEIFQAVMPYIDHVFETTNPRGLHSELAMISRVDEFSSTASFDISQTPTENQVKHISRGELSGLDTLLIIVSGLIFLSILYYFYIQWDERRRYPDHKVASNSLNVRSGDDYIEDEYGANEVEFDQYQDNVQSNGILS